MNLLICGSRHASHAMLEMAQNAVTRAKANGWSIVVGDALGVDQAVVFACVALHVPFEWYGVTVRPRNMARGNRIVHRWEDCYHCVAGDYLARDRVMVERADRVFAICGNSSRGTLYTYNYAVKLGKQADIRHFKV